MDDARSELGIRGEKLAERHLRNAGLKLLRRRYSTRLGEIDLILKHGATIVFAEVKTRRTERHQLLEEAVTDAKQKRMARAANYFLRAQRLEDAAYRFDVVTVLLPEVGEPTITHFADAFWPGS